MAPLLPIALFGALAYALMRGASGGGATSTTTEEGGIPEPEKNDPGKSEIETAQRIAKEAKEYIDGKRDAFSDPGVNTATKEAILNKLGLDANALKAAKMAAEQGFKPYQPSGGTSVIAPKPPKPGPKPYQPSPVVTPKPPILKPSGSTPWTAKPVPVKPTPIPVVAPAPTPKPTAPPGYDKAAAARAAPKLAQLIREKKYSYSHDTLAAWQKVAGIPQDGIYGRKSAAALKYFTKDAPPALFAQGEGTYP